MTATITVQIPRFDKGWYRIVPPVSAMKSEESIIEWVKERYPEVKYIRVITEYDLEAKPYGED